MASIHDVFLSLENMKIRMRHVFEWNRGPEFRLNRLQNPWTAIWLVINGEWELKLNDQSFRIRRGDLIVIPPFTCISLHSIKENPGPLQFLSLACEWKMGGFDFVKLYLIPSLIHLEDTQFHPLKEIWSSLHKSWDHFVEALASVQSIPRPFTFVRLEVPLDQTASFFETKGLLYQWLSAVFGLLQKEIHVEPELMDNRVQEICNFIDKSYSQKLCLKDLSEMVFLSESQLRFLFKKVLNISPMNYILQVRMQKAKELLMLTKDPIGKIAEAVGFEALNYFCRIFRKKEKISPTEYRRINRTFPY